MAQEAVINPRTIRRIAATDGLPKSTVATISRPSAALEAAGIAFIGTPDNTPRIRIHTKPKSEAD